jgi:DNA replication protein DnaC
MKNVEDLMRTLQRLQKQTGLKPHSGADAGEIQCKICQDRGVVLDGEIARVCSCVRRNHLDSLFRYANITPEIGGCTFDNFNLDYYQGPHLECAAKALQGLRNFTADYLNNSHSQGVLLTGDVGAGKTHLAGAAANLMLSHGVKVLFLVVPDFLDAIRATYHKSSFGETEADDVSLLRGARQIDLLVLDDLGSHNYTQWTCNTLYSLLNYRLNYQLPVIITTNLSLGQIDEYLGERTTSRIVEMCRIYRLTVEKDIRHLKNRGGLQK